MAEDTTSQAPTPAVPSAQQREQAEPSERSQPIPIIAAALIGCVLLFGAGYIALSDAPGAAEFGDRRTLADLRGAPAKAAGTAADGKQLYTTHCVACHQATGKGLPGVFPPLDGSEWVLGDARVVANILLHGIDGDITVAGTAYKGNMPAFKQLADTDLAALASHVRAQWSNKAVPIAPELLAQERKASTRTTPFAGGAELKALATKTP